MQIYERKDFVWDGRQLRLGTKRGRVLAAIEPDPDWPGLWRVRMGGHLTDMVNLTRAKDAAAALALEALNPRAPASSMREAANAH